MLIRGSSVPLLTRQDLSRTRWAVHRPWSSCSGHRSRQMYRAVSSCLGEAQDPHGFNDHMRAVSTTVSCLFFFAHQFGQVGSSDAATQSDT